MTRIRSHLLGALFLCSSAAAQEAARSAHRVQLEELGAPELERATEDTRQAAHLADAGTLFPARGAATPTLRHTKGDPIVFGYLQSETQVFHTRWHALTHVGSRFVGFNSAANLTGTTAFTGRSPYLGAGGAAEAAGVKVILVVNNFDDSPGGTIETVMTSPEKRTQLALQIAALVDADAYVHGVSLDLEFSWGSTVRDGVTAFMASLRAALDTVDPALELSIYTNAIFNANQWDFDAATGITPSIDYMLYSMYDWATGLTAHAITDLDNCLGATRIHAYLNDGLPPEKLVLAVSAYSRRWNGTGVYNGAGSNSSSSGFTDALYDVTLNPTNGGPHVESYVAGDEAGWYAWNDGANHVRTWESMEALEVETRHVLSLRDPGGAWNGRRIGGIAFWSLFWMAELDSYDPRSGTSVSRTRTYPHIYQLCQDVLAAPGERRFLLDGFEGFDFRWRDPNESPDTTGDSDGDSSVALSPSPAGAGTPARGINALALHVDTENAGLNQVVLAHELLASSIAPTVPDTNAMLGHFDATTRIACSIHVSAALAGYDVRLLVADANGELEASPAFSLGTAGWQQAAWNLTGGVNAFSTLEPALQSGDGVLATTGHGARDLGFHGFVVSGTGAAVGTIVFDELSYEDVDPGGDAYRINELRYADADLEFVELHGPAGPFPPNMELVFFDSANGSVLETVPVTGSIADAGDGNGFFVLGDPDVPNVDDASAFTALGNDIPNTDPGALQLRHETHVFDSVVTEAFGGLDDLVRPSTRGVTSNGYPWLGEIANGADTAGVPYTFGRSPDGADRRVNARDFSFQVATPGAPNGAALALPLDLHFESPPAGLFQTYDAPRFIDPTSAGLPASPAGGKAWRCVDAAGGGVLGVVGSAALGGSLGYSVTGRVYVPASTEPAQAIAVGLCGSQGSNFFTSTAEDSSGYESGYFLIYENRPGIALADGRPDHPGTWELVLATHDQMDGERTQVIASGTDADLGVTPGAWNAFTVSIERGAGGAVLSARIGTSMLFRGAPPQGGPIHGAFQLGFRENHGGAPSASEGTWVDGLRIRRAYRAKTKGVSGAGPLRKL